MSLIVIKYGGAAMKEPAIMESLVSEVAKSVTSGNQLLLVHGGGPEIDAMLKRLDIEPKKAHGLRVTDAPTMEVVEMVLAGKVNMALVSLFNRAGVKAVGLAGRDAGFIKARKKKVPDTDLGFVGEITGVDTKLVSVLMSNGFMPVICSIAEDDNGAALNVNADEAASAIAATLKADRLLFLTDVPGLMRNYPDQASLIPRLTVKEAESMIQSGAIDHGMLPKLAACIAAVKGGVGSAHILDGRVTEINKAISSGTTISR